MIRISWKELKFRTICTKFMGFKKKGISTILNKPTISITIRLKKARKISL